MHQIVTSNYISMADQRCDIL